MRAGSVAALSIGLAALVCDAQDEDFYGLRDYSTATSVADDGSVLVFRSGLSGLWSPSGFAPYPLALSYGYVSANGRYIAYHGTSSDDTWRYDVINQTFEEIPLSDDGFNSRVAGVSGDGSVVVGYDKSNERSWVWRPGEGTSLIDHPASDESQATAVSHDGSIIVGTYNNQDSFILRQGQPLQVVPTFGSAYRTTFKAVSRDNSIIVGGAHAVFTTREGHAFKWTDDAGYEILDDLGFNPDLTDRQQFYQANDTNFDGSVIVGTQGNRRAWIWDETDGMRDLKDVLENDYDYDLTNWTLETVESISADGRILTGSGAYFSGQASEFRGWVAIIPTPPAAAIGLLACLGLSRRRSSR